jgi:Short repeat of unknown function (DUF308)
VWTLIGAVLAILIGTFLVWRPFAGLVTLTIALAGFFAAHGVVQILTSLNHRQLFPRSWLWMAISGVADLIIAGLIIAGCRLLGLRDLRCDCRHCRRLSRTPRYKHKDTAPKNREDAQSQPSRGICRKSVAQLAHISRRLSDKGC